MAYSSYVIWLTIYFLVYIIFFLVFYSNINSMSTANDIARSKKLQDVISKIYAFDENPLGDGPIKEIDLSNCDLTEFPKELYIVKDTVEMINLGGNSLSVLPDNISLFTKLRILFFANNKFEVVPDILGSLPNLYMLSFKSNLLRAIPEQSLSPSVGWLILTDNQLVELPESIGLKLPKLKKFMLAGNKLSRLPDSLAHCKELELIRLAGNQFSTLPVWLFTSLPRLSWCAMAGNPIFSSTDDELNSVNQIDWNSLSIEQKLGEGASGLVYKAKWMTNDKDSMDVAVKLFKGQATSDGFPEDEMKASETVGSHPNSIHVHGRLFNTPNDQLGLVLSLISSDFYSLGGPPSFSTVTRDTYRDDQFFSSRFVVEILSGVSSLSSHLHSKHISHGDLYAHNILVHKSSGFPLLGDFGAATRYQSILSRIVGDIPPNFDVYKAIEGLEVRAFGYLIDDLLERTSFEETETEVAQTLGNIRSQCLQPDPVTRPSFKELYDSLKSLKE